MEGTSWKGEQIGENFQEKESGIGGGKGKGGRGIFFLGGERNRIGDGGEWTSGDRRWWRQERERSGRKANEEKFRGERKRNRTRERRGLGKRWQQKEEK